MKVVFLYGPPAAGKYTIGKIVAEKLGLPLFHNHLTVDLVTSLFEFGSKGFIELRERLWLETFKIAAAEKRSFVFTFNPERTIRESMIVKMIETVEKEGGQIRFVEVTCSQSEIEKRIDNEDRKNLESSPILDYIASFLENDAFGFEAMPITEIVVDTGKLSAIEASDLIAAKI